MAASTAIGTASSSATPDTHSEPTSEGRKPKLGGVDVGYQSVPDNIVHSPTSRIDWIELTARKVKMAASITIANHPDACMKP